MRSVFINNAVNQLLEALPRQWSTYIQLSQRNNRNKSTESVGFSASDWGGDLDDRKSTCACTHYILIRPPKPNNLFFFFLELFLSKLHDMRIMRNFKVTYNWNLLWVYIKDYANDSKNNTKHTEYAVIQIHACVIYTFEQLWTRARTNVSSSDISGPWTPEITCKDEEGVSVWSRGRGIWLLRAKLRCQVLRALPRAFVASLLSAFSYGALWVLSMPDFVGRVDRWSQNSHG